MDRTTENDPIILYDTEEKNNQVIAGGIRDSLEQRSLTIYLPQMEALPGSNVITTFNTAITNAGKKTSLGDLFNPLISNSPAC